MKLSIIIPYYKTYELTVKLLDNLCKQLTDEVEIILIDDGCNEYGLDKYPIKVIHQENGGISVARNIGIKQATGDYIAFIDSDDNVTENYINTLLETMKTNTFDYCLFSWKFIYGEEVIIKDNPPEWNFAVWNGIYKREHTDLFNESLRQHEDVSWQESMRNKGLKKHNIEDILYIYNANRPNSITWNITNGIKN